MSIDYNAIADAGGFGKGTPRKVVKAAKKKQAAKALKDAYVDVDARDQLVSWVSGKKLYRGVASDNIRLEHHHLDRRSQAKQRIADPFNVISVSATEADYLDCHYLRPVNATGAEVHDTRQIVAFEWNRRVVKVGMEPFKVKAMVRRTCR